MGGGGGGVWGGWGGVWGGGGGGGNGRADLISPLLLRSAVGGSTIQSIRQAENDDGKPQPLPLLPPRTSAISGIFPPWCTGWSRGYGASITTDLAPGDIQPWPRPCPISVSKSSAED